MTMPTSQCPWRMQVHHIHQETPDVWTLSLLCHDYYPYRAGQYALVSVRNSADTLRAYTISSTPGVSEYITLTIRRIDDGAGSQWLTRDVKRGDYIWLSDAQGNLPVTTKAKINSCCWPQAVASRRSCQCVAGWPKPPAGRRAGDLQRVFAGRCDLCR